MAKRTLRTPGVRRSLRPRAPRTVSGFAPSTRASAPPERASTPDQEPLASHRAPKRDDWEREEDAPESIEASVREQLEAESDEGPDEFQDDEPEAVEDAAADGGIDPLADAPHEVAAHDASQPESDEPNDHLLMASFFSEPPPAPEADHEELPYYQPEVNLGARRAMWVSAAIFAASVVCIGSYTAYQNVVMPAPVDLEGSRAVELAMPTPLAADQIPPSAHGARVEAPAQVARTQPLAAPQLTELPAQPADLQPAAIAQPVVANAAQLKAADALAAQIGILPPVPAHASEASAPATRAAASAALAAAHSGEGSARISAASAPPSNLDGRPIAPARTSVPTSTLVAAAGSARDLVRPAAQPGAATAVVTETSRSPASVATAAPAELTVSALSASDSAASQQRTGAKTESIPAIRDTHATADAARPATRDTSATDPKPSTDTAAEAESTLTGQPSAALVAGSASALQARSSAFATGSGPARSGSPSVEVAPARAEQRNAAVTPVRAAAVSGGERSKNQGPTIEPEAANELQATYDELIDVGREFSRKNHTKEALEAFRRALDVDANGVAALGGIADVYLNLNDAATAKLYATRALQADPTSSQGWIVLGAALEQLGDKVAAREAYRRCATEGTGGYVSECRALVPR